MKKKRKKILYNVLLVFFACVFIGCATYLIKYYYESKKSEDKVRDLREHIVIPDKDMRDNDKATASDSSEDEFVDINGKKIYKKYAKLYERNNDFIGWLTIKGTVIDYPVMQSMYDEQFYLRRNFDKEYSYAGTLFADTSASIENPSDNIIIYGHHMNTGKMFHELEEYEKESFYNKHKIITFDTIYGSGKYEVIAAFRTKIYEEGYTGFTYYTFFDATDEAAFDSYVSNCKKLTPYTINETAKYGDKLISLSTCAYHEQDGRYVVVAKKLEDN